MLIVNNDHRRLAGVLSLDERCKYCSKAFAEYPLILIDDADQTVYHAACAVELATEIMVDLYTFFSPPAPYKRLFVLSAPEAASHP
ncbi:MAG TPA: hypothetical protein DEV93_06470 [Chloroflexi bacterium]|jgi:hypothetical protein|nr:hypothetical protein [Chloroflexota bacterium]